MLVQTSGHVDHDVQIPALNGFEENMPEISREVNEMNWLRI